MTMKRAFVLLFVAIAAVAGFAWALSAPPVPVDIAKVERGALTSSVADEGVTRIRRVYTVHAPTPGRLLRIPHEAGDLVERNETIVAVIEPQPPALLDMRLRGEAKAAARGAEAALKLAEAEVARAAAEVRFWRAELERNERLRGSNTIAARTLEQTRLELSIREAAAATAAAGLEVRKREVERARAALIEPGAASRDARGDCCVSLKSPANGRVLAVMAKSAHVVVAGEPLLSIGDPTDIEIVVDLLSADAVRVEPGARAIVSRWGGEADLEARVSRIEPAGFTKVSALGVEEQRVNVVLELATPPEARRGLGHDFRVLASIVLAERAAALQAPLSAVFRNGGEWATFAVVDGRASLRRLKLGLRDQRQVEILEGLEEGDLVVAHPSDLLVDGAEVIAQRSSEDGAPSSGLLRASGG